MVDLDGRFRREEQFFIRGSAPDPVHLILLAPEKVAPKKGALRKSLHFGRLGEDETLLAAFLSNRIYPELAERDAQINSPVFCRKSKRNIALGHDLSAG